MRFEIETDTLLLTGDCSLFDTTQWKWQVTAAHPPPDTITVVLRQGKHTGTMAEALDKAIKDLVDVSEVQFKLMREHARAQA